VAVRNTAALKEEGGGVNRGLGRKTMVGAGEKIR
jgi:hypothetical protein